MSWGNFHITSCLSTTHAKLQWHSFESLCKYTEKKQLHLVSTKGGFKKNGKKNWFFSPLTYYTSKLIRKLYKQKFILDYANAKAVFINPIIYLTMGSNVVI